MGGTPTVANTSLIQVFGQAGTDTLLGKGGNDLLFGGSDNDTLTGGDADDQMFGQSGDDHMIWNPGDDTDLNEGADGTDTVEVNGRRDQAHDRRRDDGPGRCRAARLPGPGGADNVVVGDLIGSRGP